MSGFKSLSSFSAIREIASSLEYAGSNEAPFVFILGAGFSAGQVPTARQIVEEHLPAWAETMRQAGPSYEDRLKRYDARLVASSEEKKRACVAFWARFYENNKEHLQEDRRLWSDPASIGVEPPDQYANAYQAAFDRQLSGPLNSQRRAREFQRAIMRPETIRLNDAHFYLAQVLGDLSSSDQGRGRYAKGLALSQTVLSTNFDRLIPQALNCFSVPYCTIDDPEHEIDELEIENAPYLVHLVYVHGTLHRSMVTELKEIQRIKERNAESLRKYLKRHGAIVIGCGGWLDVILEALSGCESCEYQLYWCGLEKPEEVPPAVAKLLRNKAWSRYVQIPGADAFMRDLWAEVTGPKEEQGSQRTSSALHVKAAADRILQRVVDRLPKGFAEELKLAEAQDIRASMSDQSVAPQPAPAASAPSAEIDVGPEDPLSDVIRNAPANAHIRLRAGIYRGPIVIAKNIVLAGEGDRTKVRVEASSGSALVFREGSAQVQNVTLGARSGAAVVDIANGAPSLENCCVEGGAIGVQVHGGETEPVLLSNRIWKCGDGLVFTDRACGTAEGNELCMNRFSGATIREGAGPTLKRNLIYRNGHVGIRVEDADGHLAGNRVYENGREGIMIHKSGNPTVLQNWVTQNGKAGIYCTDSGRGVIEGNTIESNQNSGIAIRSGGNPQIKGNEIHSNNGKGIWCADNAAGVVGPNDLRSNYFGSYWKADGCGTIFEKQIDEAAVSEWAREKGAIDAFNMGPMTFDKCRHDISKGVMGHDNPLEYENGVLKWQ